MASASRLPLPPARGARQRIERRLDAPPDRARALRRVELVDLQRAHGRIVDLQHIDRRFVARPVFVDADHRLLAGVDARLRLAAASSMRSLRDAGFDRLAPCRRAPRPPAMWPQRLLREIGGQPLDIDTSRPTDR